MTSTANELTPRHADMHAQVGLTVGHHRRWLIAALLGAGAVVATLFVAGLISPTLLLYGGLAAGCGLMHLFGHGSHGGHGGGTPPAPR